MVTELQAGVTSRPMSEGARLASLFLNPLALFQDIVNNRRWWLPYVLTVLCSLCLTLSAAHKIGFRRMATAVIHSDPDTAKRFDEVMSDEQKEGVLSTTETTFKVSAASTPVLVLLYNVFYGVALLWAFKMAGRKEVSFNAIYAVLLYADLIQDLRLLVASGYLSLSTDLDNFNIQDPIGSNIGYYLSSTAQGWLKALCGAVDIFTLWYLLLIAIGCSIVCKTSRSTSITIVFGLWFMVVVVRVMWSAIA